MAAYSNLYIDQGSTFSAVIEIADVNSDLIDISIYQARAQFRKSHQSKTYWYFATNIIDAQKGLIEISLEPDDTSILKAGKYVYDVELYNESYVYRVLEGTMEITPEVTRPEGSIMPITPSKVIQSKQEIAIQDESDFSIFSLSEIPIITSLMVFVNGVYQNQEYYEVEDKEIKFQIEIPENWNVSAYYQYIDKRKNL
jgi:hypothetical protein